LVKAQELHGATLEILAQIQEKSEGTQATVATINERLLAHVLEKTLPEASAKGIDVNSRQFSELVADVVAQNLATIERESSHGFDATPSSASTRRHTAEDAAIVEYMTHYPEPDEVDDVLRALESLGPAGRRNLRHFALDDVSTRVPDSLLPPGLIPPENTPLLDRDYIKPTSSNRFLYVLTPKGRQIGRLYTAFGNPPDYIGSRLRELRNEESQELMESE